MFKTTARKHREAADIAASAKVLRDQVQQGVEQLFAPGLLEGEEMPDFSLAQDLVARLLQKLGTDVMDADSSQTSELVSSSQLRLLRNEQANKLRRSLRDARFLLDKALAPAAVDAIFTVRRFSNMKPGILLRSAQKAALALRDSAADWERLLGDSPFGPEMVLERLEEESAALELLLNQEAKQKRVGQEELRSKLETIDAVADTTQRCTEFLYGLYRLAGLDFHAERLRPEIRKR